MITTSSEWLPHAAEASSRAQRSTPSQGMFSTLLERVSRVRAVNLSIAITLLTFLLYGPRDWYARAPLSLLCVAALIVPALGTSKTVWVAITTLLAVSLYLDRYVADNHKYLMLYWAVAICIVVHAEQDAKCRAAQLAHNARWLLALVMALAVLWKTVSDDYLNGNFFLHEFLFDDRFKMVAAAAGVEDNVYQANQASLKQLGHWSGITTSIAFAAPDSLRSASRWMSWWGIGVEAIIALAFLAPSASWLGRWRDLPLLLFVITTYSLATVMGFGYILTALGAAQARKRWARVSYAFCVPIMQLFTMPLRQFVE